MAPDVVAADDVEMITERGCGGLLAGLGQRCLDVL
jgi:hypothetical protein